MAVEASPSEMVDQLSSSSDDDILSSVTPSVTLPVKRERKSPMKKKTPTAKLSPKKRKLAHPAQTLSPSILSNVSTEEDGEEGQVEQVEEVKRAAARVQRRRRCNKEQQLYGMKFRLLKQAAKTMIYENVALAKRVEMTQRAFEKETEERNILVTRLLDYQAQGIKPLSASIPGLRKTAKEEKQGKKEVKGTKKPVTKAKQRVRKSLSPSLPILHSPSLSLGSDNQELWSPRVVGGRSEGGAKGKKGPVRRIQAIPTTADGTPVFPIVIGTLKVLALGHIVHDRATFHSDRYLLPAGYTSIRSYPSIQRPSQKCEYTCRIIDSGDSPLFEMVAEDDPNNPVRASSSSQCHAQVLKAINKARGKIATNTGSGPDFFGYGNPTIMNLIQKLPNADKCTKYKRVAFQASNRMAKGSSTKRGIKSGKTGPNAAKQASDGLNASMEDDGSLLGTPTMGLSPFESSALLFPGASNPHLMDFSLSSSPSFMDSGGSGSDSGSISETKQMNSSNSFM